MIDLCPRCRIQAPHRDGRESCPRCGGPLRIVGSESAPAAPYRAPQPHRPPTQYPPSSGGPRSGRIYRSRHVRWVARRPPEAIPPRRPFVARGPRPIPRYTYLPRWGLFDRPAVTPGDQRSALDRSEDQLCGSLRILVGALALSAVVHLLRYVLLVVNRGTPVPVWLDKITWLLVALGGFVALGAFVFATYALVRWVLDLRSDAYRRRDRIDPRRRWVVGALVAVPVVNLIGAPWMIVEAADLRDDLDAVRTRRRLTRMWVAWAIINGLAVLAVGTRIAASMSGSIQTAANGVALVIVSAAVSAVFAWWLAGRVRTTFSATPEPVSSSTRWVPVA